MTQTAPSAPVINPMADDVAAASVSGQFAAQQAFLNNYAAVQHYVTVLQKLSEAIEQQESAYSTFGISQLNYQNSDLEWQLSNPGPNQQNAITGITTNIGIFNTIYNANNQYFSGLDNGANQNASDTTQTLQILLQQYQSILQQQQNLTSAI